MRRVIAALITGLAALSPQAWSQARPDIHVQVHSSDGDPIPDATTFIWTARPRTGPTMYCPSCYADCGKREDTGTDGDLVIAEVDPGLLFNLLTVADGYQPSESGLIDPLSGTVEVTLEKHMPLPDGPGHRIEARVVGADGEPIVHAVVTPIMFLFPPDPNTRVYGSSAAEGADPLAITDENGMFTIGVTGQVVSAATIRVEARGLAPKVALKVPADEPTETIVLTEGATISGQLVDTQGRPIAGRRIGTSQVNRYMGSGYAGEFWIDTDENGWFSFSNLPPENDLVIWATWKSVSDIGAVEPVRIKSGADGTTIDDIELVVHPGHMLRGRVVLEDGAELPEGQCLLLVGNYTIFDAVPEIILPTDGSFEILNLPTDGYSINARVPGYSVSPRNPNAVSFDGRIDGRIESDVDDFIILLQKGPFQRASPIPPIQRPLKSIDLPDGAAPAHEGAS